jgi:hypothetical protein
VNGRVRTLAILLAIVAVALVVRQWGFLGYRPLGGGAPLGEGPPVPGARGKLAYVRDGDLYVYDLKEGAERRMTRTGGVKTPHWSGGGGWLSFEREGKLWAITLDGARTVSVPGGDVPSSGVWGPRSARLAYASSDGSLQLYDPGSGEGTRRTLVQSGSGVGSNLAWSTDGTRVAYERHERLSLEVSNEGIWTINANGRDAIPVYLASGDRNLWLSGWTYSNTYILFWQGPNSASIAADGLPLYISRSGSSQPVLLDPAVLVHRAWLDSAPRSDAVAYVAGAGRDATQGKRLVAAEPRVVAGNRVVVDLAPIENSSTLAPGTPAWAPRGALPRAPLAYSLGPSSTQKGGDVAASLAGRRIWLGYGDGTDKRPLLAEATVPAGVADEAPSWARDGKTIVFIRRLEPDAAARGNGAPTGVEIWVSTADGSAAKRAVGGLADPGIGDHGFVDWSQLMEYYRG